jgi:hypothetical protein
MAQMFVCRYFSEIKFPAFLVQCQPMTEDLPKSSVLQQFRVGDFSTAAACIFAGAKRRHVLYYLEDIDAINTCT